MRSAISHFSHHFNDVSAADHVAFIDASGQYSYGHVASMVNALIQNWRGQGVREGSTICVNLPNSLEFVCCYLAALFGGYVIIPINRNATQAECDHIRATMRPDMSIEDRDGIAAIIRDADLSGLAAPLEVPDADALYAIFFTSGTTSVPKGVCHSAATLLGNAAAFNAMHGLERDHRLYHVMPMGYMAGCLNTLLCPLMAGGSVVIGERFDAPHAFTFWNDAMRHHANSAWLSPTMLSLIQQFTRDTEIRKWVSEHMQHLFIGTAALDSELKSRCEAHFNIPCLQSYGSTEILIVSCAMKQANTLPHSVGKIVDGTHGTIAEDGEILLRSEYACLGYYDPESGAPISPLQGGYFATGDCGTIAEDSTLCITDRKKDIIIKGGKNYSPSAIEQALHQHPDVEEAGVIGKPDDFWGEDIVAFYTAKGAPVDADALRHFCAEHLPKDAIPTLFKQVNSLPHSSTGKLQRAKLKGLL